MAATGSTRPPRIGVDDVDVTAVRSQGAGGQNVNKVASAIHLRFDIAGSSLPGPVKERLLALRDSRIGTDGVVVIKAQRFRTRERNLVDAIERLNALVERVAVPPAPRIPTRPTAASRRRRLDDKRRRASLKAQRAPDVER